MTHWDSDNETDSFGAESLGRPDGPSEDEELRQLRNELRDEEEPLGSPDDPNDDGLEDTYEIPWSEKLET